MNRLKSLYMTSPLKGFFFSGIELVAMFCTWADWDTLMPYHGPQLEMVWVAYLN